MESSPIRTTEAKPRGTLKHMFSSITSEMSDPLSIFAEEAAKKHSHSENNSHLLIPTKPVPQQSQLSVVGDIFSRLFGETSFSEKIPTTVPEDPLSSTTSSSSFTNPPLLNSNSEERFNQNVDHQQQSQKAPFLDPLYSKSITPCVDDSEIPWLTGEENILKLSEVSFQLSSGRSFRAVLQLTNYRIFLIPSRTDLHFLASSHPSIHSWLNIPLMCIDRVERERKPKEIKNSVTLAPTILLQCKDIRHHRITIDPKSFITGSGNADSPLAFEALVDKTLSLIAKHILPNNPKLVFAFSHSLPSEPRHIVAVAQYDALKEYSRQGIVMDTLLGRTTTTNPYCPSSFWRISMLNADYSLCNTYPKILIVPRDISEEELLVVAAFRSGQRLPALVWSDRNTEATIWRSSQPKGGVSGTCFEDEKYLDLIAQSCGLKPLLFIIDCRPVASAMANRATGAGYESNTNYTNTRIEFLGIDNIHAMRESHKRLTALMLGQGNHDTSFGKLVEDTQWLTYIRLIIKASWDCASTIHRGTPVLVHCSHGWDRTAQVCSLAQIFLDPFYRTMNGFQVLVEKDWISFGHPFRKRCAHGLDRFTRQEDQVGPIFLQFLDCVWQLVTQFPHYFEYGPRYLLLIASHIYSCRFGTFLCDSDSERDQTGTRQRCLDIWTYLHYVRDKVKNPLYLDPTREDTATTHVFLPPITQLLRNVTLWSDYYLRWATLSSVSVLPDRFSRQLYADGNCLIPPTDTTSERPVATTTASTSRSSAVDTSIEPLIGSGGGGGGISSSSSSSNIEGSDFLVPALITSHDIWEAAFREEKSLRLKLQNKLLAFGIPIDDVVSSNSSNSSSSNYTKATVSVLKSEDCTPIGSEEDLESESSGDSTRFPSSSAAVTVYSGRSSDVATGQPTSTTKPISMDLKSGGGQAATLPIANIPRPIRSGNESIPLQLPSPPPSPPLSSTTAATVIDPQVIKLRNYDEVTEADADGIDTTSSIPISPLDYIAIGSTSSSSNRNRRNAPLRMDSLDSSLSFIDLGEQVDVDSDLSGDSNNTVNHNVMEPKNRMKKRFDDEDNSNKDQSAIIESV